MKISRTFSPRSLAHALVCTLFFSLLLTAPAHAVLDLNSDGRPDVWAMKYGAAALDRAADSDGDGLSNAVEAAAGTDPMKPDSAIKVTAMSVDVYGYHLTFQTQSGKRYQVQSKATLDEAEWTDVVGGVVTGIGGDMTATVPDTAGQFFRVLVQDMDSDGDGVTDWEEIVLGFDPNNSHSRGAGAPDDLTAITQGLAAANVVSVAATDATATEPANGFPAVDVGVFTITRSGNFNAITVHYSVSGGATAGSDYVALSGSVTLGIGVNSATLPVTPKADALVESTESVIVTISPDAGYTVGAPSVVAVLIGDNVQPNGTGLSAQFWNEVASGGNVISDTNPAKFAGAPAVSRVDATVNYSWGSGTVQGTDSPAAGVNVDYFACRWTGEILPEFSQIYSIYADVNRAGRVWVNGQLLINNWPGGPAAVNSAEYSGTIELQAGVRYPIVVEHYDTTGTAKAVLSWSSANQTKQVIPQTRLFANSAPQILDPLSVLLIKDSGLFTYQINASGSPTSYAAVNLPPGWTINTGTGAISGTPTVAGNWQIPLTATNANGSGSAILDLTVIATGGGITRDVWSASYATLGDVPFSSAPTGTGTVAALEGPQTSNTPYGSRLRGYITAPTTGVYQFWLTGDDAAELWISDDDESVNLLKRADLTAATTYRQWANGAISPLLYLKAAQRYYVEVRHKDSAGSGHVSVGWLKPGESGTAPSEVVPGYVLSPWVAPSASTEGTLFYATLVPQNGASTLASGSSSISLSADETFAIVSVHFSNLSSEFKGMHVHDDLIPNPPGGLANVVCDLDEPGEATKLPDGNYRWTITTRGSRSAADIVADIKTGHIYFNVHSENYIGGEIKGYYQLLAGSQTFTPPPAAPNWTDDHTDPNAAARFLIQSTFGPSPDDIAAVQALGYAGWIDAQFATPATHHYDYVFASRNTTNGGNPTYSTSLEINSWWKNSVTAPDQLRQRVAFALSQIAVISSSGVLEDLANGHADYYDMFLDDAFGNFRSVLQNVTLHPMMGIFLDMRKNDKPDKAKGLIPNENYAREIMQLFSIGLNKLHPDGSLVLNSKGLPVPTYDQDGVTGMAHVFTGWNYYQTPTTPLPTNWSPSSNYLNPMTEVPSHHFTGQKRILNNVVLPGLPNIGGVALDPYGSHSTAQINDPAYQALTRVELGKAHDALFNHPTCAPFICRQLIQRFVTSTPSRGYLYRVVSAFNDNGSGVRGDMKAVMKAILLDYEARSPIAAAFQGYGKQREPVLRTTAVARAFPAPPPVTGSYSQTGSLITVTTGADHLYADGNSAFLDFEAATSGTAGQPADATYGLTVIGPTQFTARVKSFEPAVAYTQGGGIISFTQPTNGFNFSVGNSIYMEALTGALANGAGTIAFRSSDIYTIVFAGPNTKTATYSQSGTGGTTLTVTSTAHGFAAGATVRLDFVSSSAATPTSGDYTVAAVPAPTANTFTVNVSDANVSRSGTVFAVLPVNVLPTTSGTGNLCLASDAATRSGPMAVTYSDWNVGTTDTDLAQTPLRSPTVFNFYLPDYQYPGVLSQEGLVTPEFQLTSDTNVIRQVNFLYNGIFNDALGQKGLASFKSGGRDIMVDLRPWMGAGPGGLPWVHDTNLGAFIDKMNTRLLAGQLPSAAKVVVQSYVQSSLPYGKAITSLGSATLTSLTVNNHGFTTGQNVTIAGVSGGTFSPTIIGTFILTATGTNTFTIPVSCSNAAATLTSATATSGGNSRPIVSLNGFTTVTANAHGLPNGQTVTISGVTGGSFNPSINGTFAIVNPTTNTFLVPVTRTNSTGVNYTNAVANIVGGFPDLIRDRVRGVVHLLVTSPDFTIQK